MDIDEGNYDFAKLKSFHIPRKKEQQNSKDILSELSVQSREFTHTLYPAIKSSYLYSHSSRRLKIEKVELVHNPNLQKEYLEKKRDLKDEGRTDKELAESFGYVYAKDRSEVENLCENGIETGNTGLMTLGKPTMGVYVCKHADVVYPTTFSNNETGFIVIFKIVKGKMKLVSEGRGVSTTQEPTPLYDCHTTKLSTDPSKTSHIRAFQALQYYLYEYGDVDMVKRPRQIIPHAVLHFKYCESDNTLQRRESLSSGDISLDFLQKDQNPTGNESEMFSLWKGKLLVKGGVFCTVRLLSDVDTAANVAFMDKHITVKSMLPTEKFARQLPPTLLNQSGRKHNVICRGRHYNIFTLLPDDDSGMGKFRQLIAHLVQHNMVATVPLHCSSFMYLLPKSKLTVERMGMQAFENDPVPNRNEFLHAVIVTPKSLASKVNEQKLYNMLYLRKKDARTDLPEELSQKLIQMNIDPVVASSLPPDQTQKLLVALKDKKRPQTSEKLLHHHYKDVDRLLPTAKEHNKFAGKIGSIWSKTCQTIQENLETKTKKSSSKSSEAVAKKPLPAPATVEATFSDEDDDLDLPSPAPTPKPTPVLPSNDPRSRSFSQDSSSSARVDKRKLSKDSSSAEPEVPSKIFRLKSMKPLEEVLSKNAIDDLLVHPDFVLSERFEKTHALTKGSGFVGDVDVDRANQISVNIRQNIPFSTDRDCPYACDGDPIIRSMLRAVYGEWEGEGDAGEGREKVLWVRQILHLHKNQSTNDPRKFSTPNLDRTIVKETSPLSGPGGSSSDSGFTSSSTAATPTTAAGQSITSPNASSLREIASLLASALPKTSDTMNTDAEINATAQNFLKVIAKSVEENEKIFPDLKSLVESATGHSKKPEQIGLSDGSPMEIGTPSPGGAAEHDGRFENYSNKTPSAESRSRDNERPQDPRLRRRGALSHPRLSLPTYRFPPSKLASIDLPRDAEAGVLHLPNPTHTTWESHQNPIGGRIVALGVREPGSGLGGTGRGARRPMRGPMTSVDKLARVRCLQTVLNPGAGHVTRSQMFGGSLGAEDAHLRRGGDMPRHQRSQHALHPRAIPTTAFGSSPITGRLRPAAAPPLPTKTGVPSPLEGASSSSTAPPGGFPQPSGSGNIGVSELTHILRLLGETPSTQGDTTSRREDPDPRGGISVIPNITGRTGDGRSRTASVQDISSAVVFKRVVSPVVTAAFVTPPSGEAAIKLADSERFRTSPNLIQITLSGDLPTTAKTTDTQAVSTPALAPPCDVSKVKTVVESPKSLPAPGPISMSQEDIKRIREKRKRAKLKQRTSAETASASEVGEKKTDTDNRTVEINTIKVVGATSPPIKDQQINDEQSRTQKSAEISTEGGTTTKDLNQTQKAEVLSESTTTLSPAAMATITASFTTTTTLTTPPITTATITKLTTTPPPLLQPTTTTIAQLKPTARTMAELQPTTVAQLQSTATTMAELQPTTVAQLQPTATTMAQLQPTATTIAELVPTTTTIEQLQPTTTTIAQLQPTTIPQLQSTIKPQLQPTATTTTQLQATTIATLQPAEILEQSPGKTQSVEVLTEIDKILAEVKQNKSVNTTEALSDRLLQLALQLRNQNSPAVTVSRTPSALVVTTDQAGNHSSTSQEDLKPQAAVSEDHVDGQQVAHDQGAARDDKGVATDFNSNVVCVAHPAAQDILVTTVRPTMTVIPPQEDDWNPKTVASVEQEEQDEEEAIEDEAGADSHDRGTPTLDDTYNPLQENMLRDSLRKTYPNFNTLSEVSKQHIRSKGNASSAMAAIMREASELESRQRIETKQKSPLKPVSPNRPHYHSRVDSDGRLTSLKSIQKPGPVRVEPTGPPFYVFDPRGDVNCEEIVSYLRRIKGKPFHLHKISEALVRNRRHVDDHVIPITEGVLEESLPEGKLWVVIRSADLNLLPSMPYLSLMKCAGPRVQFVQADTLIDVKSRKYQHIMCGEHGIVLPVSTEVIMEDWVVFANLIHWMAQTSSVPPDTSKNAWRVAIYSHIINELEAESNEQRSDDDAGKRQHASCVVRLLRDNPASVIPLQTPDPSSSHVTDCDIVETAMRLQRENLDSARHVVVLIGHDPESTQWRRLRRAGVAVATLGQFVNSIKQARNDALPCHYSPLMGIYDTEVA